MWKNLKNFLFYIWSDLKTRAQEATIRDKYAVCCVLSALASVLSVATPLLTALIVKNIINNFNMKGIIPSVIAMVIIKGTRMLLRGRVSKLLRDADARAPMAWLQRRISKKLWWVEPIISSWGWFGEKINKLTGGVSMSVSSFMVSFMTDLINIFLSGTVYYFTQSYVLSVLVTFTIPLLSVMPWIARKTKKNSKNQNVYNIF